MSDRVAIKCLHVVLLSAVSITLDHPTCKRSALSHDATLEAFTKIYMYKCKVAAIQCDALQIQVHSDENVPY